MSDGTDEQISVFKYVEEETARLMRFAQWWSRESKKDPEMFPWDTDRGDWDEQYRCWSE